MFPCYLPLLWMSCILVMFERNYALATLRADAYYFLSFSAWKEIEDVYPQAKLWNNSPLKVCTWLFSEPAVLTTKWVSNKQKMLKVSIERSEIVCLMWGPIATGKVSVCQYRQTDRICSLAAWDNEIDIAEVEEAIRKEMEGPGKSQILI